MSIRTLLTSSKKFASVCHTITRRTASTTTTSSETAAVLSSSSSNDDSHGPPSVMESIVKLNFIDPSGARRQVPGFIGKTIYDTCEMHGIDLGPASCGATLEEVRSDTWTEPLYGEGPTSGFDHVLITGNGVETAKPITWMEERSLGDYWDDDEIFPESRLATQVFLTEEMDGMTVYVPDRLVDDMA
eukprot:CAMPEP_0198249752 /NCGR_PEP_ID=MMETSP1447-20131203/1164_1 /TAXON_ID=420782 /ORGANISM="Chaetoceros dichaeta, Strain CCMP1751" /LENGTH=186 /DNA_ID=CAMNT_0043934447 /DNA_START=93 /DNA_END=653 /DNA_ORIENTATION=+